MPKNHQILTTESNSYNKKVSEIEANGEHSQKRLLENFTTNQDDQMLILIFNK